jgi:hypothetical protein
MRINLGQIGDIVIFPGQGGCFAGRSVRFSEPRRRARASLSRCPRHRKHGSLHHVSSLNLFVAASGACSARAACFGFTPNSTAAFHLFFWLEVTGYHVPYVLFDSAPSGSN